MAKDEVQPQYVKQLGDFIADLSHFGGSSEGTGFALNSKVLWEYGEDFVRARFFTNGNEYFIRATASGYLGCVVESRKPRPGEDWRRGNDLADGKLDDETWHRILCDIVAYELKTISDYILHPEKYQATAEIKG